MVEKARDTYTRSVDGQRVTGRLAKVINLLDSAGEPGMDIQDIAQQLMGERGTWGVYRAQTEISKARRFLVLEGKIITSPNMELTTNENEGVKRYRIEQQPPTQ